MKIIALPHDNQHDYLTHIIEQHSRRGLPPEELGIAAQVYSLVVNARDLPLEENLGKATLTEAGPGGVALEFAEPENQEI
jgi:hypothetical protein